MESSAAHRNNFNFLRVFFATAVVLSHAYGLLGLEEPVAWGRSLGNLSVHGFFVISGYLICQSYLRTPSLLSFCTKRFLRIVPGLVVALVISRGLAGAFGQFAANPVPYISNGPIWTLTWEVVCYFGVLLLGVLGVLSKASMPAFFGAAWIYCLADLASTTPTSLVIVPLMLMFLSGAFLQVVESQVRLHWAGWIGIAVLALCASGPVLSEVVGVVRAHIVFLWGPPVSDEQVQRVLYLAAFPPVIIYLGKYLKTVIEVREDVSYGIYIYGWPIAQTLIAAAAMKGHAWKPLPFFLVTMVVLVPVAYLSWRIVEKPSLRLKGVAVGRRAPARSP